MLGKHLRLEAGYVSIGPLQAEHQGDALPGNLDLVSEPVIGQNSRPEVLVEGGKKSWFYQEKRLIHDLAISLGSG
jgi:hypothetical protein